MNGITTMPTTRVFLTAEWRKLAMANYAVDPHHLAPYLPKGTVLDYWNNTCYVSLVGFMFLNTKMLGMRIPLHVNFEEVNLRFYVRYRDAAGAWKRGVVFIKEIVPRPMLSLVANTIYNEKYVTMPMKHRWVTSSGQTEVEYAWKSGTWNTFSVATDVTATEITVGSEEEFITEHYWGYTRINASRTSEYGVEHPRWHVYPLKDYAIDVNFGKLYGSSFSFLKDEKPLSVFLAEGSEIVVRAGSSI